MFALYLARIGMSRLSVQVTLQTNHTFSITGFPCGNQKAQRQVLRGMAAVGITNAVMIASTQRGMRSAKETRDVLTNAGFQCVGLRLTSRNLPP